MSFTLERNVMLERVDQVVRVSTKVLGYLLGFTLLIILIGIFYAAIIYPQQIMNQTKLGMTKQQVEQAYNGKQYHYQDTLNQYATGCSENQLTEQPFFDHRQIATYMVVWTGIDGVFIVGFNKDDKAVFASSCQT